MGVCHDICVSGYLRVNGVMLLKDTKIVSEACRIIFNRRELQVATAVTMNHVLHLHCKYIFRNANRQ